MKKTFIPLVVAILTFGCLTPVPTAESEPAPSPAGDVNVTDPGKPIEARAGETFEIVIGSNPSTGYHWEIVGELSGVEFVSRDYKADEPVIPGSGGADVWTFKAVSAGATQITLGSFPPSADAAEPENTVTFDIIVK